MTAIGHTRAWNTVMHRCKAAAEQAKRDGAKDAETMMLYFAAFAGMIGAAYSEQDD